MVDDELNILLKALAFLLLEGEGHKVLGVSNASDAKAEAVRLFV